MAQDLMGMLGSSAQDVQALRQQDAQRNAIAMAQMSPQQRATYMASMAGSGLGGAVRGMLGGKDPMEAKALELNKATSQIDWGDPQSIMAAARELNSKGFTREAMALISKAQEARLSQAQIGKEEALGAKALTEAQAKQIEATAAQLSVQGRASFLKRKIEGLTDEEAQGLAADPKIVADLMKQPELKTQVVDVDGRKKLINSQTGETISDLGVSGGSSLDKLAGSIGALAAGMAAERGKKAAGKEGDVVGERTATIERGYSALTTLQDAKNIFKKGIYAGGFGPAQEIVAKYGMGVLGSKERLSNTQQFRSFLGEVVIPRLKDFGGSDSNEELKYLQAVMGSNTELEPSAIEGILNRVERALQRDIERTKAQQQAVQEGRPLPTGPSSPPKQGKTAKGTTYTIED